MAVPEISPISSVLLYGGKGCGKGMLTRAMATETGAQIFNLSPHNTVGEFSGKAGAAKLVHMVFKVARAQSPSIVFIDGFEMIFAKKVPKDDLSDPKRIKKDLLKALKGLKGGPERVLFIGSSSKPWEGEAKTMLPLFDKMLFCPLPDYGARYLVWKEFVKRRGDVEIDFSLLARMSEGRSVGAIEGVVDRVMTLRRLRKIKTDPIRGEEFLSVLLELPLVDSSEIDQFREFSERNAKKRVVMLAGPVADEAVEAVKKKKK